MYFTVRNSVRWRNARHNSMIPICYSRRNPLRIDLNFVAREWVKFHSMKFGLKGLGLGVCNLRKQTTSQAAI
jgi:hypothetical protein